MAAGSFDPAIVPVCWFDETADELGWFSSDIAEAPSGGGGGTITHVQSAHGEAGSGTSPTATFASDVTAGNLLVIVASAYRNGTPPNVFASGDLTKSSGTSTLGTAQLDLQHARATGSNEGRVAIWSIPVTGTGSLTFSLAVNAGDYANIACAEFSGADVTSGRLEDSASNDGPGTGTEMLIGDMTSADAAVFVGGFAAYTSTGTTWTPQAAFSTIYNVGDVAYNASAAIYRIVSSGTTDSADAQISPNFDAPGWAGAGVVYKAASGGSDLSLTATGSQLTLTGGAATLSYTANLSLTGTGGALTLTGGTASLSYTSGLTLTATGAALTLTGGVASLAYTANVSLDGSGAALALTGGIASFALSGSVSLTATGGALTLAGGAASFNLTGVTEEQPTGGWGYYNDYQRERQLAAARKRRRELEEEADRLEMALAADGLVTPAPEVVARFTVREYAPQAESFSRRTQRAIDYAERAQTALAFELALRQVQKEIEDEESAIAMLLALVS